MAAVDVIIPTYNAARYLPAALDSVMAQTFTDWHIVLVDDGSTDDTAAIVAPYVELLGERLTYLRQENAGLPAARNVAIRSGSAPLLALLDADDVWLPMRLELSVQRLAEYPEAGMAYGFVSRMTVDGTILSTHDEMKADGEGRIASALYTRRVDLPCPTITFRRECVAVVGGFDETMRATEDRDLWLRIAQRFDVARVAEVIALYRISPGAMSSGIDRMFDGQMRFLEKHRGTPGCDEESFRLGRSSVYRQRAETLGARRQWGEAFRSIVSALRLSPLGRNNLRTAASLVVHRLRG